MSRMSPAISRSGGRVTAILAMPSTISTKPHQRQRPSQMQSQSPPALIKASARLDGLGSCITAPGQDATVGPIHEIASMPQDIGTSANFSMPNGIIRHAAIAQGITQKPAIGTEIALAITE